MKYIEWQSNSMSKRSCPRCTLVSGNYLVGGTGFLTVVLVFQRMLEPGKFRHVKNNSKDTIKL